MPSIYAKNGPETAMGGADPSLNSATRIAELSNGNFVAFWEANPADGSFDPELMGRIYDPDGTPIDAAFSVPASLHSSDPQSSVTGLTGGGFVLTWCDTDSANDTNIKAQVFDAAGTAVGAPFIVNSTIKGGQQQSSVAALDDGGFIVVWMDGSTALKNSDMGVSIKGQVFDPTGQRAGSELTLSYDATAAEVYPSVAVLDDDRFAVTWHQGFALASHVRQVQTFLLDGTPASAKVSIAAGLLDFPPDRTVTTLDTGEFAVTYVGTDNRIKVQLFAADGAKAGAAIAVSTSTEVSRASIQSIEGGFVVAWSDLSAAAGDGSGYAVKAQAFDGDGDPIGAELLVNTTTNGSQSLPRIASLPNGEFVISYESMNVNGGENQVLFQRFGLEGSLDVIITTNGGLDHATVSIAENTTAVTRVAASESGRPLMFSILGGEDRDAFAIDTISGVLTLKYAPDFEHPADAQANNSFDVIVGASDGFSSDSQHLTVLVQDIGGPITGTSGKDVLTGIDGEQDHLSGGVGDDVLRGLGGDDVLEGGTNRDILFGDAGNDDLSGGSGSDILYGGAGNDRLDGGYDADRMFGGGGDDIYVVDRTADAVFETATASISDTIDLGGTDGVYSDVSYSLAVSGRQFIENLVLTGGANISGGGNALNNAITGNDGNNTLNGGGGKDMLTGGPGADTFVFATGDSKAGHGARDVITDFATGTDKIDLSALPVTDFTGQVTFKTLGSGLIVYVDIDHDGFDYDDFAVQLNGVHTASLNPGDFIL